MNRLLCLVQRFLHVGVVDARLLQVEQVRQEVLHLPDRVRTQNIDRHPARLGFAQELLAPPVIRPQRDDGVGLAGIIGHDHRQVHAPRR